MSTADRPPLTAAIAATATTPEALAARIERLERVVAGLAKLIELDDMRPVYGRGDERLGDAVRCGGDVLKQLRPALREMRDGLAALDARPPTDGGGR